MNEAFQAVYGWDENVILTWGDSEVSISMKSDISLSWRDIVYIMEDLKSDKKVFHMHWPSQGFWVYWEFTLINETEYKIKTDWSVKVNYSK